MGADVYATMHKIDYPLSVLPNYHDTMNRYVVLLIKGYIWDVYDFMLYIIPSK